MPLKLTETALREESVRTLITFAQEEERKRIARELHDDTAQCLAHLSLEIDALLSRRNQLPLEIYTRMKDLKTQIDDGLERLRRFCGDLRPEVLDRLGLLPALESLTEQTNADDKLEVEIEITGHERRLSPEVELALYRIAQEALHNVGKHAEADQAVISLKFQSSRVTLTIRDNGKGFQLPELLTDFAASGRLGLLGMQERARLAGGRLIVHSQPGKGSLLKVEVPG